MVSQAQGGRDGSLFLQTTLMGRVSTHPNQTPNQRRRKRSSLPANDTSRSQRQRLCPHSDASHARVSMLDRLPIHASHGNPKNALPGSSNQQGRHKRTRPPQGEDQRALSRRRTLPPITLIPSAERMAQRDLHGQNQQAADGDTFWRLLSSFTGTKFVYLHLPKHRSTKTVRFGVCSSTQLPQIC